MNKQQWRQKKVAGNLCKIQMSNLGILIYGTALKGFKLAMYLPWLWH
jgi:hypothetical protein